MDDAIVTYGRAGVVAIDATAGTARTCNIVSDHIITYHRLRSVLTANCATKLGGVGGDDVLAYSR